MRHAAPTTAPAEVLLFDGIRLRTIHYALDNNIAFKLHHAVYVKQSDGTYALQEKEDVRCRPSWTHRELKDTALVDAFPHPTLSEDYTRTVVIADDFAQPIPADAVTASASGLDPHITPDNARFRPTRCRRPAYRGGYGEGPDRKAHG